MKRFLTFLLAPIILISCGAPEEIADSELNQEVLLESLSLGAEFLLNNQKPEGNFEYEYNFLTEEYTNDDNQVRQAGALWGISLIHKYSSGADIRKAARDGINYFYEISNTGESAPGRWAEYPGDTEGSSGTVALLALALIDFLETDVYIKERGDYEAQLDEYIAFLLSLRRSDNLFYKSYEFDTGLGDGSDTSPYFDGEILLALTKYAKNFNHPELADTILESADSMYEEYVTMALDEDPDSDDTKGFYQWGTMSFYEIYTGDFGQDKYAERAIDLAYWMIDTHKTLDRTRNTGYAYEGILHAYELAKLTGDSKALAEFQNVINQGLYKLITWQVGHSTQNEYLQDHKTSDELAVGGVMNAKAEPTLRIDVTQHQMHAVILALQFFY